MRTRVYVDGFNLYYGALKGTPFRWLDPVRLSTLLLPRECAIDRLRYFTARVSGKVDPRAPARQRVYLNALATLPEVEIHYGRFLAKTAWRPLANLPVAGRWIETPGPVTLPEGDHRVLGGQPRTLPVGTYPERRGRGKGARRAVAVPIPDALIAEFHTMEEKGSDVNLAAHLLNDAWSDRFEAAVVISNDTDLMVPVRMVTAQRKRPVFVVMPGPLADGAATAKRGEPCPPHPLLGTEGGAAPEPPARHRDLETGGLVKRRRETDRPLTNRAIG